MRAGAAGGAGGAHADGPQLLRLLGRWGTEVTGQTSTGDLTRLEARLLAARLHDLQHQLPDLTGGEGVLEATFDGYQPVRGRPPSGSAGPFGTTRP